MADLKVFHDPKGQTLTVWFTEPSQEFVCEETGEGVILIKDHEGNVIGFEKLHFSISDTEGIRINLETAAV